MAKADYFDKAANSYNLIVAQLFEEHQRKTLTPERADKMLGQAMEIMRSTTINPYSPETEAMLAEVSSKIWQALFHEQ